MLNIQLRPPLDDDTSYIYSSWLKSYQKSLDNPIKDSRYWGYQKDIINRILLNSFVLLAVNPESPNQIFGYIVYSKHNNELVLHWAYTKHTFRRLGVFNRLLTHLHNELQTTNLVITSRGVNYLKIKDKLKHTYKPSYIWEKFDKES